MPLLRLLGVHDASSAERRATAWTAAMFCCVMAATGVLRPLRDQFGVARGVEAQPWLYTLTLLCTVLLLPPYWWLASRMASRRFVPIMLHAFAVGMALLWLGLRVVGNYDWHTSSGVVIGETFWGTFSAFNVAAPTLVWIHAVEHFRREQALRLFGLLSVGGTLGALLGPALASLQTTYGLEPSWSAVFALVLLEGAFVCHRGSLRACEGMNGGDAPTPTTPTARVGSGGMLEGLALLVRSPRLLGIAFYMVLYGAVATAFSFAQTQLLGKGGDQKVQHWFLANQEACSQGLVLVLQLFAVGHLLRRWPSWVFLVSLPLVSSLGVGAVATWPLAMTVAVIMVVRRGSTFAFEKPAREVLYTPFDLATKHKVKFLLDTFMFRLGDLCGASLQLAMLQAKLAPTTIALATVGMAVIWVALGLLLGRRPRAAAQPVA